MKTNEYMKRIIDKELESYLKVFGAIYIKGAKWIGKSETCGQLANTIIRFQDSELKKRYKDLVETNPKELFDNTPPILFDEWQVNPSIWDSIRHDVDEKKERGLYLLTGSSATREGSTMHSGIGRIAILKMYPMSLFETGDSIGTVSLSNLFESEKPNLGKLEDESKITISDFPKLIIRGGYPAVLDMSEKESILAMKGYYDGLINEDIISIDDVKRNPSKMNALLRSYARNISTYTNDSTMKRDMENEGIEMDDKTFADYKNTLEKLYIIDNVPYWPTSIRSKRSVRKSDKKHLVDPAIACATLGLTSKKILDDYNYFGFLFESLCLRDLRIYAESIDGKVYNYRDDTDFEIDYIIELRDGSWGAIEVKLGAGDIDEAASNLIKFRNKIDTDKKGEPKFLMVLYGGKYSYPRPDGVLVVPIGCLKN